jgi:hypothetical protein
MMLRTVSRRAAVALLLSGAGAAVLVDASLMNA